MFGRLLEFASPAKIIIILSILSALVAAGFAAQARARQAGYDRAEIEFTGQLEEIRATAAKEAVADWKAAQTIAGEASAQEIKIVEKIRIVEREIPKIIERIVEVKPECSDLPELGSLFSQQADIANSRQAGTAADPGEPSG